MVIKKIYRNQINNSTWWCMNDEVLWSVETLVKLIPGFNPSHSFPPENAAATSQWYMIVARWHTNNATKRQIACCLNGCRGKHNLQMNTHAALPRGRHQLAINTTFFSVALPAGDSVVLGGKGREAIKCGRCWEDRRLPERKHEANNMETRVR